MLRTLNDKPKSGLFSHVESRIPDPKKEGKKLAVTFCVALAVSRILNILIFEQARANFLEN